ncbi:unnamed protein product [Periconia digitata]|uniref:F-box domain-containing protein n=1 Tax=Periconia digitata TaxID=1303443 RepID=A0A9W4XI96_9PLEO|nr:unnamed protein product [Periconia digitata]
MPVSLDGLPYDILFFVTSYLSFEDILSLGDSHPKFKALLLESTLCRRTIETHVEHTKDAQSARDYNQKLEPTSPRKKMRRCQKEEIAYIEAMKNIHDKRIAFQSCLPYSARVLGHGNGFCYRRGSLCILKGSTLRILDTSHPSQSMEIDLTATVETFRGASTSAADFDISLMYYSDDIAAILYEKKARPNESCIYAISTKKALPSNKRLLLEKWLETSYKFFCRHTAKWLYYGTYSAMGSNGRHHEWEIQGVSLTGNDSPAKTPKIVLEGFFGADIGSTVAFEIRDGFFYAVSNQTSFEVEEIDWTSFYHIIRFPLENPRRDNTDINKRLYRRQHAEGPIHDSWTELTIQFDDATGQARIVESRREWVRSTSEQKRTFYIADFNFDPSSASDSDEASEPVRALPDNDLFTTVLDDRNKPSWAPEQQRLNPTFHTEFAPDCRAPIFTLSRTKLKAYNLSTSSFLDLVEDEHCCNETTTGSCMRIRVGSRRTAPLDWVPPCDKYDKYTPSKSPKEYLGSRRDVVYRHSPIRMWPPPATQCACSRRLHKILNPPLPNDSPMSYNRHVVGSVDEHGLVYMIRSGRPSSEENQLGVIVMVSFTRGRSSSSVERPPLGPAAAASAAGEECCQHQRQIDDEGDDDDEEYDPDYWRWKPGVHRTGVCH